MISEKIEPPSKILYNSSKKYHILQSLMKTGIKLVLKHENLLERTIVPYPNVDFTELKKRLTNTLILVNHDFPVIDTYYMPFILSKLNIKTSVVINDELFNTNEGTIFSDMTKKFNVFLIPRRGAVKYIIEHIKEGRSVIIFYDFNEFKKFREKKSVPVIMEETGCHPVFLKYTFDMKPLYKASNAGLGLEGIRLIFKIIDSVAKHKELPLNINVSENMETYEQVLENHSHIKTFML